MLFGRYEVILFLLFLIVIFTMPSRITWHFFIIIPIIISTSYLIWTTNVEGLQHNRNFYRALNYHILEHDIINIYWFGQGMINYPINEYFLLGDVQDFMQRMQSKMGNLELLTYGLVDQQKVNQTVNTLEVYYRRGGVSTYAWTLEEGIMPDGQPFSFDNLTSIKAIMTQIEALFFVFKDLDLGSGNIWDVTFKLEPFSDTSVFVHTISHQKITLSKEHLLPFIFGVILALLLLRQYFVRPDRRIENLPYYFVSVFLVVNSIIAFSEQIPFEMIFIFDGVTCLAAWLCTIRFYLKQNDDYNLSFLLGQSYAMIGRLFASFGPFLMAFSLFAYVVFSRYSGQFSTFWRTFLSLFYICYYNMTYESTIVTARSNPISLIFFMVFVLVFTICIYSGMLVSVFCSYVWRKREQQIRKDIQDNLRIQCSACDHKYKYEDSFKAKPKKSFRMSQFLQIDFQDEQGRDKYKRMMRERIDMLRTIADKLIDQNKLLLEQHQLPLQYQRQIHQDLTIKKRFLTNLLGDN